MTKLVILYFVFRMTSDVERTVAFPCNHRKLNLASMRGNE